MGGYDVAMLITCLALGGAIGSTAFLFFGGHVYDFAFVSVGYGNVLLVNGAADGWP